MPEETNDTLDLATVELRRPTSYAERMDVREAWSGDFSPHRVLAAALVLCWPRARRVLAKRNVVYKGNVATFGGAAIDSLIARGVTEAQLYSRGADAFALCLEGLPDADEEVAGALGNSGAPTGPGT